MVHRRGAAILLFVAAVACTGPSRTIATLDPLAGTYLVKGGGAALDVFNALSDAFRQQHLGVKFEFEDIGSAAGMKLASTGNVDLATSSATPAPDIASEIVVVPVGSSGTAVIVGAANPVAGLSKSQVKDMFSGAVADWSAVGGQPGRITVVVREASSALRGNFDAFFFGGKGTYAADAIELNTGEQIISAVATKSGVVSMLTIDAQMRAEKRIKALAIDGIAPTKENVTAGRYPVRRPLFLVYREASVKPAVRAFIDFVRSPAGQDIIARITSGE